VAAALVLSLSLSSLPLLAPVWLLPWWLTASCRRECCRCRCQP
jgi:hypothetical protein